MKYLKKDVAVGCLQADKNIAGQLKAQLKEAQDALGVAKAQQAKDYMLWRENVEEIILREERGEQVFTHHYNDAAYSPTHTDGRARRLGMIEYDFRRANEKVEEAYQAVINHRPSALTVFLTSIDDEFVTDVGIKAAGFNHGGLGKYVVLGKQGDL